MCSRFELNCKFENLPKVLKDNHPINLKIKYESQNLLLPNDPVLVIKNEGKMKTTFMNWGFISPWSISPSERSHPRPYNARSETILQNKLFKTSWRYKRCLIPATGFIEKGIRFRKKDSKIFGLLRFGHYRLRQMVQN